MGSVIGHLPNLILARFHFYDKRLSELADEPFNLHAHN